LIALESHPHHLLALKRPYGLELFDYQCAGFIVLISSLSSK
jgi:hypothetical protein